MFYVVCVCVCIRVRVLAKKNSHLLCWPYNSTVSTINIIGITISSKSILETPLYSNKYFGLPLRNWEFGSDAEDFSLLNIFFAYTKD